MTNEEIIEKVREEITLRVLCENTAKEYLKGTVNIYNSSLRFIFGTVLCKTLNYQMIPLLFQEFQRQVKSPADGVFIQFWTVTSLLIFSFFLKNLKTRFVLEVA